MTGHSAIRPEDVLSDSDNSTTVDGVTVRKGTIAAFIANAKLLETIAQSDPRHAAIERELRKLAPAVRAIGILDVFTPRTPRIASLLVEPQATSSRPFRKHNSCHPERLSGLHVEAERQGIAARPSRPALPSGIVSPAPPGISTRPDSIPIVTNAHGHRVLPHHRITGIRHEPQGERRTRHPFGRNAPGR